MLFCEKEGDVLMLFAEVKLRQYKRIMRENQNQRDAKMRKNKA